MSEKLTEEEKAELRGDNYEGTDDDLDEDQEDDPIEDEDLDLKQDDDNDDGEDEDLEDGVEEEELDVEEEDEPDDVDEPKIPRSRLNKESAKRKKAEERSLYLEEQLMKLVERQTNPPKEEDPKEDPYDFSEAEENYLNLILDGEVKKAASLRKEINVEQRKEVKELIEVAREDAVKQSTSERHSEQVDIVIKSLEKKYPALDNSSDDYDEDIVEDINALMVRYVDNGLSQVQALNKAVERMIPTPSGKLGKSPEREKAARKKAASTLKRQPSKIKGKSTKSRDLDTLDVASITDSQWKKLSSREKAILRGDIIE